MGVIKMQSRFIWAEFIDLITNVCLAFARVASSLTPHHLQSLGVYPHPDVFGISIRLIQLHHIIISLFGPQIVAY